MIQLVLIIYLCISISKIAKEKEISATPYIIGTIAITILPSLLVMLISGHASSVGNIFGAILGIALAFIPRASLRAK